MRGIFHKTKGSFDVKSQGTGQTVAEKNIVEQTDSKSCVAWRYYIASLIFISACMVNIQRMSVAIAVVNMSNYTSPRRQNVSYDSCSAAGNNSFLDSSKPKVGGDFNWDTKVQGYILGAGFFGTTLTTIFAGPLANAIGSKRLFIWINLVSAVAMLVSPIVVWWHVYFLIVVQFVRGLAQSFHLPACILVMSDWTPRRERSFISSFMITGYYIGSMLGGMIAGYLCDSPSLGWRAVFYFCGGAGVLFCVLFALTFYETPKDHPGISKAELKYIIEDQDSNKNQEKLPIPWAKIFTSVPTYALIFGHIGRGWSLFYFLSVHPAYLSTILHYPIHKNGLISSLPFLLKVTGALLASSLSDWLYRRKYVGVDKLRRGYTFIGYTGFSLSMVGIYFARCSNLLNILFLLTALFFVGISTPGACIAAVDMSPNFSATLTSISGVCGNLTGFVIPILVGFLTKNQTMEEWQNVFLVNIIVLLICAIVFAVFGSAEVQPWNFTNCGPEGISEKKKAKNPTAAEEAKKHENASKFRMKYLEPK